MAVAVAHRHLHQSRDLGFGEVFAGSQLTVGEPSGRNCSIYGGWGDQLQV